MKRLVQWLRRSRLAGKGKDVYIGRGVHITRPWLAHLGNHVALDDGFYCTTQLTVRDYSHIAPQVVVIGGKNGHLWLEGFNTIGPHCTILCGSDAFRGEGLVSVVIPPEYRGVTHVGTIRMGRFSNICSNVVVTPNVTIGEGAVVGANSFVNRDLEPWTVYVGTPAKPLRSRPRETMKGAARKMGYL